MGNAAAFMEQHGYWLFGALGFAEFAGVPVASVPALLAGGALAARGSLRLGGVAVSAALGGLLADAGWYGLLRWQGRRLVNTACSLAADPRACVLGVRGRVERLGGGYILSAKFIPGAGNLVAAAAGLARIRPVRFLLLDGAALLLWAGGYAGLGWLLSEQVGAAVALLARYSRWSLAGAGILLALATLWRLLRARRHAPLHRLGSRAGRGRSGSGPRRRERRLPARRRSWPRQANLQRRGRDPGVDAPRFT